MDLIIFRPAIWPQLLLEFWLIKAWFFAHLRDQSAVTRLENVGRLNKRWGKKLGFQLSQRQPLIVNKILDYAKKTVQNLFTISYYKYTRRCSVKEVFWNF